MPRSIMSSFDLSAPFRQGIFLVGRKEFWKSFAGMFKQFGSKETFEGIQASIRSRPTYRKMTEAGLALSEMDGPLHTREEQFMSDWAATKLGPVSAMVRASNRAYVGFLNKLRADVFDDILKKSVDAGIDFDADPKALKDIARFVNAATGRGDLGKLNQAAPVLSGLLFSPRLMASRIAMLNPMTYASYSPVVRKEALKSLLSFGAMATTVIGLAAAGGADVETDMRSSDFAKIKIGDTRFDMLGGFQQYLKFFAQQITGKKKTASGKLVEFGPGFGKESAWDSFLTALRTKFSPVAGFIADARDGENVIGEEFNLGVEDPKKLSSWMKNDAVQMFVPLFLQDLTEAMEEYGLKGALTGVPAVFGVGVQTYKPKEKKDGSFMDTKSSDEDWLNSGSSKSDDDWLNS
jgi:hypothetical protein